MGARITSISAGHSTSERVAMLRKSRISPSGAGPCTAGKSWKIGRCSERQRRPRGFLVFQNHDFLKMIFNDFQ